jgi:hypothetical protein
MAAISDSPRVLSVTASPETSAPNTPVIQCKKPSDLDETDWKVIDVTQREAIRRVIEGKDPAYANLKQAELDRRKAEVAQLEADRHKLELKLHSLRERAPAASGSPLVRLNQAGGVPTPFFLEGARH